MRDGNGEITKTHVCFTLWEIDDVFIVLIVFFSVRKKVTKLSLPGIEFHDAEERSS
jgi:hypothetical protein